MKSWKALAPLAMLVSCALSVGAARDASACAVFTPTETPSVTGHRMILSVSNTETTLWDQFDYKGAPESFGWILPIKGVAEVGLSSDALFDALGQVTAPQIFAPSQNCPNSCDGQGGGFGGGVDGGSNGGVVVVAQQVVGPFEMVQLSSQDPNALKGWLAQNGYPIPAGIGPILDAYVAEGFDFVALKLLPGMGLDSVKPVRVTVQGAAPSIPLRLLAAGTGDLTPVTIFVLGEGRWEPTNAPVVEMKASDLVWDFKTESSNYAAVRASKLAATSGLGWLVEQARPFAAFEVDNGLQSLVSASPADSGYGDAMVTPQAALDADLAALHGALSPSPWIMRYTADLSRQAFAKDLSLGAAASQTPVDGVYGVTNSINEPPCPPDPCGGQGGNGGSGASSGNGGSGGNAAAGEGSSSDCGCRVAGVDSSGATLLLLGLAPFMLGMRRRRR